MMNVREALKHAEAYLRRSASPALDAELLLAHVLGLERSTLLAHPEKSLNQGVFIRYRWLVARRQRGVPLAYLVGYKDFYGRRFAVSRATLIPRPATELVVEHALALAEQPGVKNFIDVGTGSGCLGITLAAELPGTAVIATDISARALAVARRNAQAHGVAARVRLLHGNLLEPAVRHKLTSPRSLVVANLPYLTPAEVQGEIMFEPRRGLVGGADGLTYYRELASQLAALKAQVRPGWLVLEAHPPRVPALLALLKNILPKSQATVEPDLAGWPRVLVVALA